MVNAETPARERRPKVETARLGDEIYRRDVKAQVKAAHDGDYVAIDVDSGNWSVAESELAASGAGLCGGPSDTGDRDRGGCFPSIARSGRTSPGYRRCGGHRFHPLPHPAAGDGRGVGVGL